MQSVVADTDTAQAFKSFKTVIVDENIHDDHGWNGTIVGLFSPDTRFILIGDDAQLPPVSLDEDALSVTGDLIVMIRTFGTGLYFPKEPSVRCRAIASLSPMFEKGMLSTSVKLETTIQIAVRRMLQKNASGVR